MSALCRDAKLVCSQHFMSSSLWNLLQHNFSGREKYSSIHPVNSVATEFSMLRHNFFLSFHNFCRDKKLLCRDRLSFFGPCRLLSCLLRHRNLCCNTLDLAYLSSHSISIVTKFSFIAIEFYHSIAFIVAT